MTYKSSVEKSELLLDSFYLGYEDDDSFRSIRNEDDQSVRIDQSVRMRDESSADENSEGENSDSENSEDSDHQEENIIETFPPAESLTEVQSVGENLIPPPADSSQPVRVDQAAPLHAAEETLVVSADQDDDDQFILADDPKPDEMINSINDQIDDQSNNRLISDENNPLILNYSRSKIRHDYKQLHHRDFVKAAKHIESIESTADHDSIISKIFEQIINDPQAKE
jgi:hypothetical protein